MSVVLSPALVLTDILSGGGVINANNPIIGYHNLVTDGVTVATTEHASYPVTNLENSLTHLRWQGTDSSSDEYLTMTLNTVDDIDYVAIARHNFFSAQITVSLEIFNGVTWDEVISEFIPPNDTALLMRFEPQAVTQVRVKLQPSGTVPRAAVMYAGKLLIVQRRLYVGHTPITYGRKTVMVDGYSENGEFVGRIVKNTSQGTQIDLNNLSPDWYREYFDPFVEAAQTEPFFFAWRPGDYGFEVGFCWTTGDPIPSNESPNGFMKVSFPVKGISQ